MNVTKHLEVVFVLPEYAGQQNVIRRVHWLVRFEDGEFSSDAYVETFLDVDNISNFVPANQVGNDTLLQWAFEAQGGDEFVAQLLPFHIEQIERKRMYAGQVSYTEGFVLPRSPYNPLSGAGPTVDGAQTL